MTRFVSPALNQRILEIAEEQLMRDGGVTPPAQDPRGAHNELVRAVLGVRRDTAIAEEQRRVAELQAAAAVQQARAMAAPVPTRSGEFRPSDIPLQFRSNFKRNDHLPRLRRFAVKKGMRI